MDLELRWRQGWDDLKEIIESYLYKTEAVVG